MSTRNACRLFIINSSVFYYKKKKNNEDDKIREELFLLANQHQTWGFWTMHHRLRNLGFGWKSKIRRSQSQAGLQDLQIDEAELEKQTKKTTSGKDNEPLLRPMYPNVTWSMDFMHDTLENGKSVRSLNIIDDFNREILNITIDTSLPSARVVSQLEQLIDWRGKPEKIRVDNGPEFIAEKLKDWCEKNGIIIHYIQPGKPTQNSLIERFNRTFRTEFLDVYLFENLKQMRNYSETWMWMYNNERPHSALQYLTPRDFLLKYGKINNNNSKDFPTFQQNFNNDNSKLIKKNSTFECA
ncbi:IS3 family transposase [Chryseobacterium sp. MYb264]|uniref:IS3 family transposase n=1 Tax=Chryseobacterium sp. MYb264 TaxID=2745153 RepID=UPI002E0E52D3|nr:IS3 family transposase [Chryseobacterium sp. MYb264]